MLNDTVITGLLNLFALLSVRNNCPQEVDLKLLSRYLGSHFGVRNKEPYLDLFCELYDLYSTDAELDRESIVEQICANLKSVIAADEQQLLVLRLMEFCHLASPATFRTDDDVFVLIARCFGTPDAAFEAFVSFVTGQSHALVRQQRFEGYDGHVRTLWVASIRRLLFAYEGQDEVLLNDVPVMRGVFQEWHESGVLKNHRGAPLYYATVRQAYDDIHRRQVRFCGRDVNFRFPGSDNGMHDLSFDLTGGQMVAIMGGSGAGKTTLMSLLNGTLRPQQGSITLDGHDICSPEARAMVGYVPQDDLLVEELTVYQNLYYTARLCFDGMSRRELHRRVMTVLDELGLAAARDLKVGSPLNKVISGGQRKRLNIALELLREPAVLMLDEPTSGLSSADSEHVVGLLKQQAIQGRLVIMNIHQPSSDVYKLFDRLWLLDRGGFPVFDGNPIDAITYFKSMANYADATTSTCPTCGNVNPEIVLNIIDEKALGSTGRLTQERKTTPQQWHQLYLQDKSRQAQEATDTPDPAPASSPAPRPGWWRQFLIQLERNVMTKVTNRQYLLITLLEAPLLALFCAWLQRYAPDTGYTLMDNKNFVSYMFMAVIVTTFIGMSGSAEEIIRDRLLLKREKFLRLSYGSYITSKVVLMALVSAVQTLLFIAVGNSMLGFFDLWGTWWLILFCAAFLANLTGLLLSQCLGSVVAIYISIPVLLIPQILLCGVVVDFDDLDSHSQTGNVPMIGEVIPSRWAFEALAVTTYTDNAYDAPLYDARRQQYQDQYYRLSYIYEMQSQLETREDEKARGKAVNPVHDAVLRNSLPVLARYCGLEPYDGPLDYAPLSAYIARADSVLSVRSNAATLGLDRIVQTRLNEMGREACRKLRVSSHNNQLENTLQGVGNPTTHHIVDGRIVAQMGRIYLDPVTRDGRAPFYSAIKQLGPWRFTTLQYNLMVMAFMALLCCVMLYTDCLGRYLRKDKE